MLHWTLLPKKSDYFLLPPPFPPHRTTTIQKLMFVCLLEKFACIQEHFFCASLQTFLTAFHPRLQLRFLMRQHFFFNVEPLVSLYIAHKIHKNNSPLLRAFSSDLSTHKCVPTSSQGFLSPCYLFNQEAKM